MPRVTSSIVQVGQVGGDDLAVLGMHARGNDHPPRPAAAAHGHQHRLGHRAAAVVEARVGDVHAGQLRDERLVLEQRLEVALAHLGLVGRVGGDELAAGGDEIDHGGDEVVVAAAAEEAGGAAGRRVCGRPAPSGGRSVPARPSAGGMHSWRPSRSSAGTMANSSSSDAAPMASSIARWSSAVFRNKAWI